MKKLLFLLFLLTTTTVQAQKHRFRIMEYNVENLFDTLHAPQNADQEFTPTGEKHWTSRRYWSKLGKLSRVIAATGENTPADLVALTEVENDSVIHHLVHRTKLWRLGYDYIITHSPDLRGINVALLYQPHRFRPLSHDTLRLEPQGKNQRPSRDILHVAGELTTGDTLDIFVCHFPSRKGGKNAERYRMRHAQALRQVADRLMHTRRHPQIIITGDFNAYYPEKCLTQGLQVRLPHTDTDIDSTALYLLSHRLHASSDIRGTYKFQGEWNQLDQFIVNGALLPAHPTAERLSTSPTSCRIVDFPWLLSPDRNREGVHPHRSYLGNYYTGGYSDHLPLILDLYY